jgi:chromosome segregation protein
LRLKTLKISGFKSFADKVVISFDDPIIGIVGPNGCGKSNIVDAIRWVLGEQSARSLRGGQMQDVIFAGSHNRKPLQMAEVTVVFDEIKEGELALPYSEVAITRRLYKEGHSEYILNKEVVRLKDIQSLFLGTGVGKGAFSIFEQGKIDQIISLTPIARREIFDEAAGIGRFLERKKETIKKLDSMMDNYHRIKDLHSEVDRQTKQLKKQAAAAEHYLGLKQQAEMLEKNILITKVKQLKQQQKQLHENLQGLHQQKIKFEADQAAAEASLNTYKLELKQQDQQVQSLQEKLTLSSRTAAMLEAQLEQQKKRREELLNRQRFVKQDCEKRKEALAHLTLDVSEKKEQLCPDLNVFEAEVKKSHQQYVEAMQKRSECEQQMQAETFKLDRLLEAEKRRQADLEKQQHRLNELHTQIATLITKTTQMREAVEGGALALKERELTQIELQKKKVEQEKLQTALLKQEAELTSARRLLEKLKADREGFSAGAKHLLSAACNPKHELYRLLLPLTEGILAKPGMAGRVDGALHRYRQTLVVKDQAAYDKVMAYAAAEGLKDFSIFKLQGALATPVSQQLAETSDMASHFLSDATFDEQGRFVDHKQVLFVFGDSIDAPFQQEARLRQIEQELVEVHQHRSELNLDEINRASQACREQRKVLDEQHRKLEMNLLHENFQLQRAQADLKEVSERLKVLEVSSQEPADQAYERIKTLQLQKEQIALFVNECESIWQSQAEKLKQEREKSHQFQLTLAKYTELQAAFKKLEQDLEHIHQTLENNAQMISRQDPHAAQAECEQIKQQLQSGRELLQQVKGAQEKAQEGYLKVKEQLHKVDKVLHAAELKIKDEIHQESQLASQLQESYQISIESALESDILLDNLAEAELSAKNLRKDLEKSGAVNLTAIESYAEESKRFEQLDTQLRDLMASKQDLEALIAKLDHESRKMFKETFEKIKENFQNNFQTLFGGGEAELRFTDSHDILEAGVDIIAKPPGKQMRSISLLSGGEKCLTALALLFSIFEVRPAPFCVLDEVDAPLDESNVGRFTQMLDRFIEHTQFLIVTHNKRTMAMAHRLLGVSMEEKGISKLLSLTFAKSKEMV